MVGTDPFTRVSVEAKPALYWPLLPKQSDVKWLTHTHTQIYSNHSRHIVLKRSHCLFCCSVAGTEYRHLALIFTANNREICVSNSERRHCETLLSYHWTHRTSPRGWTSPSWISPITAQRRPAYDNDSCPYLTKGAESEQLVGGLQRPCRNCSLSSFWKLAGSGRTSLYM